MVIRYGEGGAKLEGKELTKFMSQLDDYLSVFDKVCKRLRNEIVVRAFAETFANEGKEPARRADFETQDKLKQMRVKLREMEKTQQFKSVSDVEFDEEHRTYSVTFVDAQGAPRKIDWTLANAPETRQLLSRQAQSREQLEGPFLIEYATKAVNTTGTPTQAELDEADEVEQEEGVMDVIAAAPGTKDEAKPAKRVKAQQDPVEKKTPREVFDYVIEQGRKEYQVQRYKGLGEMTAPQLWETTMDPARRTLLQVKLEDLIATEDIFSTLMGEDVEARRKFIEENALDVKNLDI
jgi:DNA gyrase subunit B